MACCAQLSCIPAAVVSVNDPFKNASLDAHGSTPADMDKSQLDEFKRWGPLVKRVGFTAES